MQLLKAQENVLFHAIVFVIFLMPVGSDRISVLELDELDGLARVANQGLHQLRIGIAVRRVRDDEEAFFELREQRFESRHDFRPIREIGFDTLDLFGFRRVIDFHVRPIGDEAFEEVIAARVFIVGFEGEVWRVEVDEVVVGFLELHDVGVEGLIALAVAEYGVVDQLGRLFELVGERETEIAASVVVAHPRVGEDAAGALLDAGTAERGQRDRLFIFILEHFDVCDDAVEPAAVLLVEIDSGELTLDETIGARRESDQVFYFVAREPHGRVFDQSFGDELVEEKVIVRVDFLSHHLEQITDGRRAGKGIEGGAEFELLEDRAQSWEELAFASHIASVGKAKLSILNHIGAGQWCPLVYGQHRGRGSGVTGPAAKTGSRTWTYGDPEGCQIRLDGRLAQQPFARGLRRQ